MHESNRLDSIACDNLPRLIQSNKKGLERDQDKAESWRKIRMEKSRSRNCQVVGNLSIFTFTDGDDL